MCLDIDDFGALAVLHGLQNEDKVNLLGVCYNEVRPLGASVIDAINNWFNRGNIPIGIYMNYDQAFKDPDPSDYFTHERCFDVDNMPHDPFDNIVGYAIAVYKHILKNQADNSVVIISFGFLNNLYDLLKDPEGYALLEKKVKLLIAMGGFNNDGFNFSRHGLVDQTQYVIENWPGTLVTTDEGGRMITVETLKSTTPVNNPVRRAYELEWKQGPGVGYSSWDQLSVLYAVYGTQYYDEKWEGGGEVWSDAKHALQLAYEQCQTSILEYGSSTGKKMYLFSNPGNPWDRVYMTIRTSFDAVIPGRIANWFMKVLQPIPAS